MHPSCTCCGNTDLRQNSRMGDQHFVLQCCWGDWSMGSAVLSRDSGLCAEVPYCKTPLQRQISWSMTTRCILGLHTLSS